MVGSDGSLRETIANLLRDAAREVVAAWDSYLPWPFRWYVMVAAVLLGLAICFGPAATRALRRGRRYKQGWISEVVRAELKRRAPLGVTTTLRTWIQSLAVPNMQTAAMAITFVLLSYPIQYLLSFVPLCRLVVSSESAVESLLGTLLQTHATVAGVALPLVVFLIERAKDEEETRMPASEVIMRESYIVPVTIFALVAGVKMAWDLVVTVSRSSSVLSVNTLLFSLTVLFTARALISTLSLSFGRVQLKEKGLDLVRFKAALSAEQSVRLRLAENALVQAADELRVGFWIFGVDRGIRERFHVVEARQRCKLTDANIVGLREFVESLPLKGMVPAAQAVAGGPTVDDDAVSISDVPGAKGAHKVFLVRRIGQSIHERAGALLLVEKAAVESFEAVDGPYWVKRIFKLERV